MDAFFRLAEDIERMRMLLNAPAMHVYGVSYGTSGGLDTRKLNNFIPNDACLT